MAVGASAQTSGAYASERDALEAELNALRTERYSWWVYWGQLATYYLPRRYRWLVTPNQMNRGTAINGAIIDSTGTIAARTLASGMMSGITSPTRPWFKLRIPGVNPEDEVNPVNIWLADCVRRMMRVFQESNFYNAIAVLYLDLAIFGTAPMLIYEDFDNVIQCYNPCAGEYYVWNDDKLRVGGFAREMTMTILQMVTKFGKDNCSPDVVKEYEQGGAALTRERKIIHFIKTNTGKVAKGYAYYECYFEQGGSKDGPEYLALKPFHEQPFICPRWEVTGNDAYGRSVGMDGLGDVKQLQQETKAKAQTIDKIARPPMVADIELKNKPASTLPGGTTFVAKKDGVGFKPAYDNYRPPIQEMSEDIREVRQRIKDIFFNDLFLMISQLDTVRTATEIDARREEKLVMLGPVLERFQTEGLDPIIDRVFAVCSRAGVFLPPPPQVSGAPIEIEYVSMLAEAQRAANSTGMERFLAQLGNVGAVHPDALDIPNWDRMLTRYALVLGNEPSDLKSADELAAYRQQKAAAQAKQQLLDATPGLAKSAMNLADTNVGGGQNALQQIMFGPGGSA